MKKKLYVIHSPSYVDLHPSHTLGKTLVDDPISEHFTYVYYNLIKFGLIDEVIIFPRAGRHDDFRNEINQKIYFENDINKSISLNWNRENMIDIINNDTSYTFLYSNYDECKNLKNTFTLFNPVTLTTNSKNTLSKSYHHYALIEGFPHENKYKVLPNEIPRSACPLTSNQFTNLNVDLVQKTEKVYDWIIVSALDPRKRHVEFLNSLLKNPKFKNLRGCFAFRNPDNRGYKNDGHQVFEYLNQNFIKKYGNIDVFFNASNDEKINLLSKSKIFVCLSTFDSGPRAVIEAIQAGLPIFTMPHFGSSDWVLPGKNGEFVNSIEESGVRFYHMLETYDRNPDYYFNNAKIISEKIKPENLYPDIIKNIKYYENFYQ